MGVAVKLTTLTLNRKSNGLETNERAVTVRCSALFSANGLSLCLFTLTWPGVESIKQAETRSLGGKKFPAHLRANF